MNTDLNVYVNEI